MADCVTRASGRPPRRHQLKGAQSGRPPSEALRCRLRRKRRPRASKNAWNAILSTSEGPAKRFPQAIASRDSPPSIQNDKSGVLTPSARNRLEKPNFPKFTHRGKVFRLFIALAQRGVSSLGYHNCAPQNRRQFEKNGSAEDASPKTRPKEYSELSSWTQRRTLSKRITQFATSRQQSAASGTTS